LAATEASIPRFVIALRAGRDDAELGQLREHDPTIPRRLHDLEHCGVVDMQLQHPDLRTRRRVIDRLSQLDDVELGDAVAKPS
jgi:hypothetical protein